MSDAPEEKTTFTMKVSDAEQIKIQTETQLAILEDAIRDCLTHGLYNNRRNLLSLLTESYSVNHKLNVIVKRQLRDSPREIYDEVEEILINAQQMVLVQTLTMSQYMINLEMVREENFSTSLH